MFYSDKQVILNSSRDKLRLEKIREKLQTPNGGLFKGRLPNYKWAIENLGESFDKVILASNNIERLSLDSYTVLGGWCAIRTRCINDLQKGIITDTITGKKQQYKTVDELCNWLMKAIALDQIIEAIGSYNGDNYTAISEEYLWLEKIVKIVNKYFNRKLNETEIDKVLKAIKHSEEKRSKATELYLSFIKGKRVQITKVRDIDIFQDLIRSRDSLFDRLNITKEKLTQPMVLNRNITRKIKDSSHILNDLYQYIDRYSIVWFMYTGYYLDLLKDKGYVKTDYAIIIEPYSHARSNESESEFKKVMLSSKNGTNNYLVHGGINEKLGFIATDEVSDYSFHKFSRTKMISEVPNINNYNKYLELLSDPNEMSKIDLKNNIVFVAGINYLPYGRCRKALINMIHVKEEYMKGKKETIEKHNKSDIYALKKQTSSLLKEQSLIVLEELERMMRFVFKP